MKKKKTIDPASKDCERKINNLIKKSKKCDKKIKKVYQDIVSDCKADLQQNQEQLKEWKAELKQAKRENNTEMIEFYQWCIEEIEEWVKRDKERIKTFSPEK